MLEIADKNLTKMIIKVFDQKTCREVDKAVDPILYQLIQNLEEKITLLTAMYDELKWAVDDLRKIYIPD